MKKKSGANIDEAVNQLNSGKSEFSIKDFENIIPDVSADEEAVDTELSDIVEASIQDATNDLKKTKVKKMSEYNKRAYQKRKTKTTDKREKSANQPKGMPSYLSYDDYAVNLVMKIFISDRYKMGSNVAPIKIVGNNAYGKECKKNAYERLHQEQTQFKEWGYKPEWVIISRDDVMILDPEFINRLKELQPHTHVAGPIGVTSIRKSGKFYRPESADDVRGLIVQGESKNPLNWNIVKAPSYDKQKAFPVVTLTSGIVAVRYETFMSIDFESMSYSAVEGFYHFISDICLSAVVKNKYVAVIKTLIRQESSISQHVDDENFNKDHIAFVRRWSNILPVRC